MKANRNGLTSASAIIVLLASLLVIISFFLPWFSSSNWFPSREAFSVSGAMLAGGRFYDVYAYYPQTPQETFWLLWLVPLIALVMGRGVLAVRSELNYVPRSLILWSILPLIGLLLVLLFLHPLFANTSVAYGYWLAVLSLVVLFVGGWFFRIQAFATLVKRGAEEQRARRRVLWGLAGLAGVVVVGGIAFYWSRFARQRIPVYSNYADEEIQGVNVVSWSPDGKRLAEAKGTSVQVWDALTANHLQKLEPSSNDDTAIAGMAWSPDGKYLAAGQLDRAISVWEVATGAVIFTSKAGGPYLAWSADSQTLVFVSPLASASGKGVLQSWNVLTGSPVLNYHLPDGLGRDYHTVAWSRDGKYIAAGGLLLGHQEPWSSVDVWNAQTGNLLFSRQKSGSPGVATMAWSPDGAHLALAGEGNGVVILDRGSQKVSQTYDEYSDALVVSWSPDGQRVASDANSVVLVWNFATGDTLFAYKGHTSSIRSIAWSPDGQYIASSDRDGVQVWQP